MEFGGDFKCNTARLEWSRWFSYLVSGFCFSGWGTRVHVWVDVLLVCISDGGVKCYVRRKSDLCTNAKELSSQQLHRLIRNKQVIKNVFSIILLRDLMSWGHAILVCGTGSYWPWACKTISCWQVIQFPIPWRLSGRIGTLSLMMHATTSVIGIMCPYLSIHRDVSNVGQKWN